MERFQLVPLSPGSVWPAGHTGAPSARKAGRPGRDQGGGGEHGSCEVLTLHGCSEMHGHPPGEGHGFLQHLPLHHVQPTVCAPQPFTRHPHQHSRPTVKGDRNSEPEIECGWWLHLMGGRPWAAGHCTPLTEQPPEVVQHMAYTTAGQSRNPED